MSFRQQVRARYCVAEKQWSRETYWTCFAYDGVVPDDLHCTHKFMGEQTPEAVRDIVETLDRHFAANPFQPFTQRFDREEFFGPDKDVRVLRPASDKVPSTFLPGLRAQLDPFMVDRYGGGYKPHVSTDDDAVEQPFTRYCLCQGDKILKEWS